VAVMKKQLFAFRTVVVFRLLEECKTGAMKVSLLWPYREVYVVADQISCSNLSARLAIAWISRRLPAMWR